MQIQHYLDSTYLKTSDQADISDTETKTKVEVLISEAIENNFKLVMIRPEFVSLAKKMINDKNSSVLVGTVIGFHEGTYSVEEKISQAQQAIDDAVDELDFVVNYTAFLEGRINLVKSEIFKGTQLALSNDKVVKWIIEIAALTNDEIIAITQLIRDTVLDNFGEENAEKIFVKSSTGFYKTTGGKPNGATLEAMELIVNNAKPLLAKAAGGVRSYKDAEKMISIGVSRIGTSSAKAIAEGNSIKNTDY